MASREREGGRGGNTTALCPPQQQDSREDKTPKAKQSDYLEHGCPLGKGVGGRGVQRGVSQGDAGDGSAEGVEPGLQRKPTGSQLASLLDGLHTQWHEQVHLWPAHPGRRQASQAVRAGARSTGPVPLDRAG